MIRSSLLIFWCGIRLHTGGSCRANLKLVFSFYLLVRNPFAVMYEENIRILPVEFFQNENKIKEVESHDRKEDCGKKVDEFSKKINILPGIEKKKKKKNR